VALPETRRSFVLAAGSRDPAERTRAFEVLVAAYSRGVRRHLRARWRLSEPDAEDAAQGFFTSVLERGTLQSFDPRRGRFRSYLLACLDSFASNARRRSRRQKRGGGAVHLSIEEAGPAGLPILDQKTLEGEFQREWARSVFTLGLEALTERCRGTPKEVALALFVRYDVEGEGTTYAALARELGLPPTQVTNHLAWARRAFREEVLRSLRAITASEAEFEAEARVLFGSEAL
jgi:RNA polymerase sigma-70 factor (ECF subfamily)